MPNDGNKNIYASVSFKRDHYGAFDKDSEYEYQNKDDEYIKEETGQRDAVELSNHHTIWIGPDFKHYIRQALCSGEKHWKTFTWIARNTPIPKESIPEVLRSMGLDILRCSRRDRKTGDEVFCLKERYMDEEPLIMKIFSRISGRIL